MSEQVAESGAEPQAGRVWWWLLRIVVVGSGVAILISLFDDFRGRWDYWEQGDWLINSLNGPIRRGPTGSMLIHLADWMNVSPITTVVLVQAILAILLYAAYYRCVTSIPDPRMGLLLSVSPALFVLMWPGNLYEGALRKELIGMAAAGLVLVYLRDRKVWTALLACALLAVGAWGHEVVILFVPVVGYLLWLGLRRSTRTQAVLICSGAAVVVVSSACAAWYALHYTRVPTVMQVCRPLLHRGVDERICSGHGALDWVKAKPHRASKSLHHRDLNVHGLEHFAIMLVVGLAALVYVAWLLERRRVALIGLAAAVPFLPLFVVVSDWGRWLACCVFAFVAVVIAHVMTEDVGLRRPPPAYALVGLLLVGVLIVPDHINGIHWGGDVRSLRHLLSEFVHCLT